MVFPAMAGVHMLIGVGEGIITALVLVAVARVRPELVMGERGLAGMGVAGGATDGRGVAPAGRAGRAGYGVVAFYGVLIALGLALFVSPLASQAPDGLDKTAERQGFAVQERKVLPGLLPDYQWSALGEGGVSKAVAGAAGTLVVLGLSLVLARILVPRKRAGTGAETAEEETGGGGCG